MVEVPEGGKSYYEILGLVRSATPEEIQAAYLALARKWHPDVSPDLRDAATNFKSITEAYEVLGDPERRRQYDRSRAKAPLARGPSVPVRPSHTASHSRDSVMPFALNEFPEHLREMLSMDFSWGTWDEHSVAQSQDTSLDVDAELPLTPEEARDGCPVQIKLSLPTTCQHCRGQKNADAGVCAACGGTGVIHQGARLVTLRVPPGVRNGSVIQIRGAGKTSSGPEPPGNLRLLVRIQPYWDAG